MYKWIVFLHSTTNPELPVLNRYYGVLSDGEIRVRGLEVRKHDTPGLINNAQMDMVKALSSASNCEEFVRAIPKARLVLNDYIEKVREGSVDFEDLIICRNLSRSPSEYSVITRQAAAVEQLNSFGVRLQAGQRVKFVILNSGARNPFRRVLAAELPKHDSKVPYDKEEYVKLLQRAFDNMFPPNVLRVSKEPDVINPLEQT
jgi:DNA polymerase-2